MLSVISGHYIAGTLYRMTPLLFSETRTTIMYIEELKQYTNQDHGFLVQNSQTQGAGLAEKHNIYST